MVHKGWNTELYEKHKKMEKRGTKQTNKHKEKKSKIRYVTKIMSKKKIRA